MNFFSLKFKDKFVYFFVLVFLCFLAQSEALKNIAVYLLIVYFLIQILTRKLTLTIDILNISILAHLVTVILGIWIGINSSESINQFMDIVHIVFIFLFFRESKLDFLTYETIIQCLFYGFILAGFIGLFEFLFLDESRVRLNSVGSVNRSAVYTMYIFITALCLMGQYRSRLNRIIFPFIIIFSALTILFSASRMAIFSLPVILLLYFYYKQNIKLSKMIIFLIYLIPIPFIVIFFFPNSLLSYKLSLGFSDMPRIQIWIVSIYAWLENNLLFGIGVGNSIFYDVRDYFYDESLTFQINNTHNVYLDMLLERGIIGLTTFLTFLSSIFFLKGTHQYNFKIFLRVLVVSLLLMGMANITFRYEFALLFVTLVGSYLNPTIQK